MMFTEYNFFKLNFIEPASPLMYGIIELHDHIFFFLNMILFLVLFLLLTTLRYFDYSGKNSKLNRYLLVESVQSRFDWIRLNHGTSIEIIWTIIPSIVLILIAIPSFALLYATDELVDPSVTIQVIGHQWYWSYEYNDLTIAITDQTHNYRDLASLILDACYNVIGSRAETLTFTCLDYELLYDNVKLYDTCWILEHVPSVFWTQVAGATVSSVSLLKSSAVNFEFDSYMRQESDLILGEHRLYETDFPLILPKLTHIRFMITADDVIHSWSVPALGIKVDAVPGRINHAHTFIKHSGMFYGQCSELCGVNHGFMPIQIIAFEPHMYYDYLRLILLNK